MKRFRHISTLLSLVCILLPFNKLHALCYGETASSDNDSIKISLLTCAAGDEVYSLYGHTAIRYTDYIKDIDVAVNYGVFSFKQPFFVLRFIFGKTDYEMGIMPFDYFCMEYAEEGRSVYQQELNLTHSEKVAIRDAIETNYLPQNRVYRYNYFYDNCTTRARDILIDKVNGDVLFEGAESLYPSYRELIHSFNSNSPWARFGNDLLLGVKADRKTTLSEQQFLPFLLKKDFDKASIKAEDGSIRPLVERTSCIIDCPETVEKSSFPLRPRTCAWVVFALIAALTLLEMKTKKKFWGLDIFLMVFDGCVGMVVFLMFFSELPATNTNLQILLFNPLPLFFVYRVAKSEIKGKVSRFWSWAACVLTLFFIGGFFQQYAEGMYVLASSLLVRCLWNIVWQNKYLSVKK